MELLVGIVRKDLQVKYQGSVLGFVWSLANPLLLLVVYSFVFGVVLKSGIPHFGFYLLTGLLIWNFFSGTVAASAGAVVGNAGLVQKVPFPHAVLPLASVGFNVVQLGLQLGVMIVVMVATGFTQIFSAWLLLAVPAIAVALVLATGLAFLVSALNVRYRDTQHLVEIILMAGFWLNPIVYPIILVEREIGDSILAPIYWLNPMADVVVSMQRALYSGDAGITGTTDKVLASDNLWFYVERLAVGGVIAAAVLAVGVWVFHRMSADFAENL